MKLINFMKDALDQATIALELKEVPVGAVVVKDNTVIARAFNLRETTGDPTAHAEILAIKRAAEFIGSWRLTGCSLYVTLEPCPMCAGAIVQSRISKLYIGTFDPKAGACGSVMNIVQNESLNHYVNVHWMYDENCSSILTEFFKEKRSKNNLL
jgi:tRNA(adenine34) deaminase